VVARARGSSRRIASWAGKRVRSTPACACRRHCWNFESSRVESSEQSSWRKDEW
jgi:hypothetical protein